MCLPLRRIKLLSIRFCTHIPLLICTKALSFFSVLIDQKHQLNRDHTLSRFTIDLTIWFFSHYFKHMWRALLCAKIRSELDNAQEESKYKTGISQPIFFKYLPRPYAIHTCTPSDIPSRFRV